MTNEEILVWVFGILTLILLVFLFIRTRKEKKKESISAERTKAEKETSKTAKIEKKETGSEKAETVPDSSGSKSEKEETETKPDSRTKKTGLLISAELNPDSRKKAEEEKKAENRKSENVEVIYRREEKSDFWICPVCGVQNSDEEIHCVLCKERKQACSVENAEEN